MSEILFTPEKINNLELKNRIIMTAMHLGHSIEEHTRFYSQCAKGGASAIVYVAGVNDKGGYMNMGILRDEYADDFKKMTKTVEESGSHLIAQLFHAGRNGVQGIMGNPEAEPVAPSAIASPIFRMEPHELTLEEIKAEVKEFGKAAAFAKEVGFAGVEISCSAGYLLTQFLSPLSNQREDEYGGSEENRMRFPLEVAAEVRRAVGPDYPVLMRLSGADFLGGYDVSFVQRFVQKIPLSDVDAFSVTGGWHESGVPQIDSHVPKGGWASLAAAVKRVTDAKVIACNRINDEETAEGILQRGMADFVGCARAFLTDQGFATKMEKKQPYVRCIGCNIGCIQEIFNLNPSRCALNPIFGWGPEVMEPVEGKPKVLVVGGGPSGLNAAKFAAVRGCDVTLATKEDHLGGKVIVASCLDDKKDLLTYVDSLAYELDELGVEVKLNTEVDGDYIEEFAPDHVYLAVGSLSRRPDIPGIDTVDAHTAVEVISGGGAMAEELLKGGIVILGGGQVGVETALYLANHTYYGELPMQFTSMYDRDGVTNTLFAPADITILEQDKRIGADYGAVRGLFAQELRLNGVKMEVGVEDIEIKDSVTYYKSGRGEEKEAKETPIKTLVYAAGEEPYKGELIDYIENCSIPYDIIGCARQPSMIRDGMEDAYQAVNKLK